MADTMREEFEEEVRKWFDPNRAADLLARDSTDGDYEEWGVMLAWESYKAAHEAGRQLGMSQANALWEMVKDSQEIGGYKTAAEMAKTSEVVEAAADGQALWLWQNGDHFLAFEHLYPCYSPGGDPMTLGEPFGRAVFRKSFSRGAK